MYINNNTIITYSLPEEKTKMATTPKTAQQLCRGIEILQWAESNLDDEILDLKDRVTQSVNEGITLSKAMEKIRGKLYRQRESQIKLTQRREENERELSEALERRACMKHEYSRIQTELLNQTILDLQNGMITMGRNYNTSERSDSEINSQDEYVKSDQECIPGKGDDLCYGETIDSQRDDRTNTKDEQDERDDVSYDESIASQE